VSWEHLRYIRIYTGASVQTESRGGVFWVEGIIKSLVQSAFESPGDIRWAFSNPPHFELSTNPSYLIQPANYLSFQIRFVITHNSLTIVQSQSSIGKLYWEFRGKIPLSTTSSLRSKKRRRQADDSCYDSIAFWWTLVYRSSASPSHVYFQTQTTYWFSVRSSSRNVNSVCVRKTLQREVPLSQFWASLRHNNNTKFQYSIPSNLQL